MLDLIFVMIRTHLGPWLYYFLFGLTFSEIFEFRGVIHIAEAEFSKVMIEFLGEIKTQFENILACLSGAQMG